MTKQTTLVWFRQDLRIKDNPALNWAVEQGSIIPLYILDEESQDVEALGPASKWWLHHSLESLNKSLDGHLVIRQGKAEDVLAELASSLKVNAVVWNRRYEPGELQRDKAIKQQLKDAGLAVKSFNGSLLWEPMSVVKKDGTPYKVYTPYYRNGCLGESSPRYPLSAPSEITFTAYEQSNGSIEQLDLIPSVDWAEGFSSLWQPGEAGASTKLSRFIEHAAKGYREQRNLPSVEGTSKLSPHLHFGEMSPNQAWYAILDAFGGSDNDSIDTYLSELGWREFSYYLLYHWPQITTDNFNPKFDHFPWSTDQQALKTWQRGQTGVPIVDAGMRELWQTGFMHNRVRMVVGSFLVKNLLLDWREGAKWFWDCLLDADLAANTASWQWVAGSGADAAPYFRIFNPILQGEKFDKQGEYVKTYCPELSKLPAKYIHKPWEAPESVLAAADILLGTNYPKPVVDLKESRQRALGAYEKVKG